jgi:hypothetical protein
MISAGRFYGGTYIHASCERAGVCEGRRSGSVAKRPARLTAEHAPIVRHNNTEMTRARAWEPVWCCLASQFSFSVMSFFGSAKKGLDNG